MMQVYGYLICNYLGKLLLINDALPYTRFTKTPLITNGFKPQNINFTFEDIKFVTYYDKRDSLNMIYYCRLTRKPKILDDNIFWVNITDTKIGIYNLTLVDKEILNVCFKFLPNC